MCLALVAVVASVSGLNVAQQALAIDLGASQSQVLWIINGYTLALAALLLPIGAIGDRWGRKPVLARRRRRLRSATSLPPRRRPPVCSSRVAAASGRR